jgi:hypothetical protein
MTAAELAERRAQIAQLRAEGIDVSGCSACVAAAVDRLPACLVCGTSTADLISPAVGAVPLRGVTEPGTGDGGET